MDFHHTVLLLQALSTTRRAPRRTSTCGRSLSAWWTSSAWRCRSVWMWRRQRLPVPRPPNWPTNPPSYLRSAADCRSFHPSAAASSVPASSPEKREKQIIYSSSPHTLSCFSPRLWAVNNHSANISIASFISFLFPLIWSWGWQCTPDKGVDFARFTAMLILTGGQRVLWSSSDAQNICVFAREIKTPKYIQIGQVESLTS